MSRIIETIEVDVPIRVAYDQWTRFESFPHFMAGIDRVVQVDDATLEWTATSAFVVKHWRTEIVERQPDDLVAWRSLDGVRNDGLVRFEALGPDRTRVVLQLDVEPDSFVEKVGDALGVVERRVRGDLERFRDLVESPDQPAGAWRGHVEGGSVRLGERVYGGAGAHVGPAVRVGVGVDDKPADNLDDEDVVDGADAGPESRTPSASGTGGRS